MAGFMLRIKSLMDSLKVLFVAHKKFSLVLSALLMIFVFAGAAVIFSSKVQNNSLDQKSQAIAGMQGTMALYSRSEGKVNGNLLLSLVADSNGSDISAWDVVIRFDPTVVAFTGEKNLVDNFDYMRRVRGDLVYVSAVKKLEINTPVFFKELAIFELNFKPLKAGNANFEILYTPKSTYQSSLWDSTSVNVLSKVTSIKVEVK